jgi:hypothetical protein
MYIIYSQPKKKFTKIKFFTILILLIFCTTNLSMNLYFFDLWFIVLYTLFYFIFPIIKGSLKYLKKKELDKIEHELNHNHEPDHMHFPLEGMEKFIYERDFKQVLSEHDFRVFFEMAELKKLKKSTELAREGESFENVFYFAKIPGRKSIVLKNKDTAISYLEEGSWIGVVELIMYNADNNLDKWLVDLHVHYDIEEIVYYQWDKNSLVNLMNFSTNFLFVNKVLKLLVKYLVYTVMRLDDHVANALRAILEKDKNARIYSIPICKKIEIN